MTNRLTIIHLTDFHFGNHRFDAPEEPQTNPLYGIGRSLIGDLSREDVPPSLKGSRDRIIFALTGDFAQKADMGEFDRATEMINSFVGKEIFGQQIRHQDIFLVPGNHDLAYDEKDARVKWGNYFTFYENHTDAVAEETGQTVRFFPRLPEKLTRIIDQSQQGLIVAEINSSAYVQKDTKEANHGIVPEHAIGKITDEFNAINEPLREAAIKIALVHHHPVVLPQLQEAERGYDALVNADKLLYFLKRNHFIILLHGHKHFPVAFTYDPVNAWTKDEVVPMLVVAGGSVGVMGPELPRAVPSNSYNVIDIKWYPSNKQARIRLETRKLVTQDEYHMDVNRTQWKWETLRVINRVLTPPPRREQDELSGIVGVPPELEDPRELERAAVIKSLRRNYPVVEVLPAFGKEDEFEAHLWIECQTRDGYEAPCKVDWIAGAAFPTVTCLFKEGTDFEVRFSYYGPMLVQCRLHWGDGTESVTHIFAHSGRAPS